MDPQGRNVTRRVDGQGTGHTASWGRRWDAVVWRVIPVSGIQHLPQAKSMCGTVASATRRPAVCLSEHDGSRQVLMVDGARSSDSRRSMRAVMSSVSRVSLLMTVEPGGEAFNSAARSASSARACRAGRCCRRGSAGEFRG